MLAISRTRRLLSVVLVGLLSATGLVAVVALAPSAGALSAVVWVAPTGTDAGNDCSVKASPCATVNRADSQVTAGGTINVSGTLHEHVVLTKEVTLSGLEAPAGAPAVLDGDGTGRVVDAGPGTLVLRGLTITDGYTTGYGGGVRSETTTIDRVTFSGNKADLSGGGIAAYGPVTILDSTFANNVAGACGFSCQLYSGGGVAVIRGDNTTIVRSTFNGNSAESGGGGVNFGDQDGGSLKISDSTFAGNTVKNNGSAVSATYAGFELRNSTVNGGSDDALYLYGLGDAWITGSTVVGTNYAVFAQSLTFDGGNRLHYAGSVLASGFKACTTGAAPEGQGLISEGYNVLGDSTCGTPAATDTVAAANLGALADNGGPTQTRRPNAGSPAIGKVPTGTVRNATTLCARKDQRGVPAPTAGQTACAAGAVEAAAGVAPAFTSAASKTVGTGQAFTHTVSTSGPTPTLTVAAATPLPAGVTFTDNRDGTATLAGTAPAPATVTLSFVANNGVGGSVQQSFVLTVSKNPQATLTLTSTSGTYAPSLQLALTTSGGSGTGALSFTAANGTATGCAVSGGTNLTATSAGTCTVTATKAADATFLVASSVPTTVTIAKAPQTPAVTVTSLNGTVGTPLTLTATGGTGGGVLSYTAANGTATGCTVSSGALSATGAGTCLVTATRASSTNYLAASSVPTGVTMRSNQLALSVTSLNGVVGTPLTLTTAGGSGTGVRTFALGGGTATGCALSGGTTLSATSAGTCIVTASKAGDGSFNPAASAPTAVTFRLAQPALTVTSLNGVVGTALPLTTAGGAGTGQVSYSVVNGTASGCGFLVAGSLSATAPGTCLVTATKAADATHAAVSSAPTAVSFKANQATLVISTGNGTFGTPLNLAASGGTGEGAVTFTVLNGTASGCAVSAEPPYQLTSTGAGTCLVTAVKAGTDLYLPKTSAQKTLTLGKATQAALTITSKTGTFGTPLTLTTSGGSGTGAVTYTVVNGNASGCAISAGAPYTLTTTSAGTCAVTATKAADANHLVRTITDGVSLGKAAQAPLTLTSVTGAVLTPLTLTTAGGSGTGALSYLVSNGSATGCAVAAGKLSATTPGTCTVTASKGTDQNYLAASAPPTTVTLGKATQAALTVTSTTGLLGSPLTLTASGGSGTGALSFAVANGTATGCAITGGALSATTAGTCTVTATKATDALYLARSSTATAVTLQQPQTALVVTSLFGLAGTQITLTTSGGSGTGAVTFTVSNGTASSCAISAGKLTAAGLGTCLVTATKAADGTFPGTSSAPTAVRFRQAQAALTVTSSAGNAGTPLPLTTSGGSGTGAVSYTVAPGTATGCAVDGSQLSATTPGTCLVTATKAGDSAFQPVSSPVKTVTFAKKLQAALTVTSPTSGTFGTPITLSVSGGSGTGGQVFEVANGTASGCLAMFGELSSTSAGTCVVTAVKQADAEYLAVSSAPVTVTFAKKPQAVTFVSPAPADAKVGLSTYTPTALGGTSGSPVVFTLDPSSTGCALSGSTVTFPGAGTCRINANQAGDGNHLAAPPAQQTFTVAKAPQVITFTSAAPTARAGGPGYLVSATGGGSGNAVTFSLDASSTGCVLIGDQVGFPAAGTCVINADQAGSANHLAAPQAQQTFTVAKGTQKITFTSTAPVNVAIGAPTYTVTATGGLSNLPVTFALDPSSSGCTLSGNAVDFTDVGTCVINADQAGNANYLAAPRVQQRIDVGKAPQTVVITSTAPAAAKVDGPSYPLTATGGASGNPVVFSLDEASTGCALTGATVTFPHAGTCRVSADQAGDADYAAAPQVQQTFTVAKAAQAISFSSTPPANATVGSSYPVAATGGASGQPVVFSLDASSTGCTLAGASVTFTAAGTCVVDADQAGDADYTAAPRVQQSIAVGKGSQAVNFTSTAPVGKVVGGSAYTVSAAGGPSGNPVTFSLDAGSTGCSLSGSTVTFPHAGTCVILADQAGGPDHTAAPQVQQTFVVGKAPQTIAFTSTAPSGARVGGTSYTATATGGGSGSPVTFSLGTGSTGCALAGAKLTFIGVGTCVVQADQAGDADHLAAAPVQQSFAVAAAAKTATRTTLSIVKVTYRGKKYWKFTTTVRTATGNATGPVVIKDTRPGHPTRGLCYLTLSSGAAKCLVPVSGIGKGLHLLTASYKPTAKFASSYKTIRKVF